MAEKKKTTTKKTRGTSKKTVAKKSASTKTDKKKQLKKPRVDKKVEKNDRKREFDAERVVYARSKYIRSTALKARLVIDMVRGMNALDALARLEFVPKKAAGLVHKTIQSAVSNAVNNFEMDRKGLFIAEAFVDEAPTFKRGRAGSRGRYNPVLKRNCHIIIGVQQKNT